VLPATRHRQMSPALTLARQAGTRFSYHRVTEGYVDLGGWLYTEMVYLSADSHPSNHLISTWLAVKLTTFCS